MRNSITVMNAKGGVGKSSLVLTLAETLSAHHGKRVLVIDFDAHASISTMLISPELARDHPGPEPDLRRLPDRRRPEDGAPASWRTFVITGVSDVDDARSIDLMLGGGHLTLFEREVSKGGHEAVLRLADSRLPGRGAPGLRPHPDRQRPRPVGPDRVLAARGGFLPVAGQARLPLDARAAVSPAVRASATPRWASPKAWASSSA